MSYQVVKYFTDLKDHNHPYKVGDSYPREGVEVSEERITELAGSKNRQKQPLIKAVEVAELKKENEEPADKAAAENKEPADTTTAETEKPEKAASKNKNKKESQ